MSARGQKWNDRENVFTTPSLLRGSDDDIDSKSTHVHPHTATGDAVKYQHASDFRCSSSELLDIVV